VLIIPSHSLWRVFDDAMSTGQQNAKELRQVADIFGGRNCSDELDAQKRLQFRSKSCVSHTARVCEAVVNWRSVS